MSIPIYQNTILLAPVSILKKMEALLKKFLWEGGKGNLHRIHLISWNKLKMPYKEGGMQVRDLANQNLAMGAKTLWNLIAGKDSWSSKALRRKYFQGDRLRCLDNPIPRKNGSPIYKLCLKALPLFQPHLHWIPGNGKKINLWKDAVMGEQPIGQNTGIQNIKEWAQNSNLNSLWDISSWEEDGSWKDWHMDNLPIQLYDEKKCLLSLLQGKTPSSKSRHDKRGWGQRSGSYSAKEGYKVFTSAPHVAPNPAAWTFIWHYPFVPKIDFFCWTTAHKSILTGENLKNRGMEGPSRCPLCCSDEETIDHLLLNCPFSKEIWAEVLLLNIEDLAIHQNITELFATWATSSPFGLHKKDLLKTIWMWAPKAICWKIWLERNSRIFRDERNSSFRIATKCKALLGEFSETKSQLKNSRDLDPQEKRWLSQFRHSEPISIAPIPKTANWEIHLEENDFLMWRSTLSDHSLFFDGASKGNPGQAGGGGVLLSTENSVLASYAWGLGSTTNNMAEALALWQGLKQAQEMNVHSLAVFGDSKIIIQALRTKKLPPNFFLSAIIKKIRLLAAKFTTISFFHILRGLNAQADKEANKAAGMDMKTLMVNGRDSICFFP